MARIKLTNPNHFWLSPRGRLVQLTLGLGVLLLVSNCLAGARGVPAQEGVTNFAKVDEQLFRGAQPDEVGIRNLQRLGVKTIINLRQPGDTWEPEPNLTKACGIGYTNVGLNPLSRPTDAQMRTILALIENSPGPVFVHCQHGCDRTGTVIACYRIQHDGWSSTDALREAVHYGLSSWETGMKSFIVDFAKAKVGKAQKNP